MLATRQPSFFRQRIINAVKVSFILCYFDIQFNMERLEKFQVPRQAALGVLDRKGFQTYAAELRRQRSWPFIPLVGIMGQVLLNRAAGLAVVGDAPASSSNAREQSDSIAAMLWLTNSTVRPPRATSSILPRHFRWNSDVADRQHLVDDQDLRLQVGGHRERQPHVHAAGVALHRRVEELLDLGERDDLVELPVDLAAAHAQDRAVEVDVLAAGQLGVEAGADLQQAADAAAELDLAGRRLGDPREDLQQRALAGAVAADDADDLARLDLEVDVLAGPRTPRVVPRDARCRGGGRRRSRRRSTRLSRSVR